jgi:anti-anti-sigma factor
MSRLTLAIERVGADETVAVVRAEGEIDLSNADEFAAALTSDECARSSAVVLDLLSVPFMDSSGLRSLLVAAKELEGELVLALQPGSPVLRLLELAEVSERIRIFATVDEAVEGVSSGAADST